MTSLRARYVGRPQNSWVEMLANLHRTVRYKEELNKWLDPIPMVDDYNRIRGVRLENTCEWIDQERKYLSWRASSRRNVDLWVRGPPGCGKSTLAASIIDRLSVDRPTAYFFCNTEDPDRSNFTRLLRTLTWQLVLKKPQLADSIYNIYLETAGAVTPMDSYKRALASLLKNGEPCYVIIDGLDECRGDYTEIQKIMFHISSYAKLLVVSRWETWIQQCFPLGQMTPTLGIEMTHTSQDLRRFIDVKSQDLDLEPALAHELALLIVGKARGMFLWVKLTIEYLSQQATLEDTIEALKDLPEGLESLYERLIRRIKLLPKSRYKLACKLIQWTFSSVHPLSLKQLKVALSVTPGKGQPQYPDNVLNLEKFVRESCSPLLEVDEAKGTIRFVHASAIDYLSRATQLKSQISSDSLELGFVPKVANAYCAGVCLTYLSAENIDFVPEDKDPRIYSRNLDIYLAQHPFIRYCALNWWKHLPLPLSDSDQTTPLLGNAIELFTSSQKSIVRWMQLFQLLGGLHGKEIAQATLFRSPESPYAWRFADKSSLFHHLWLAPSGLFTRWQRWRTEIFFNGRYSTPMGIASFFNFLDVVQFELARGKQIDNQDPTGLTSALLAALGEAPNVLHYAIESGADMSLTSAFGYGSVRYATRNSISVLPRLLGSGATVGVSTLDNGMTPIHAACTTAGFHPSILPQLLKHASKDELDAKTFSGRTALHLAASIKIQSYARLVFDRGLLVAGAVPQHRRLHAGFTEEAFMPSTRAEVKNWLHSWNNHFAVESNGSDSESLACHASELNEDNVARLVRKIKASMIIWLVESGASICETDSEGRTALDNVLITGFAEDLEVIDDYCLSRLSRALSALGAMESNTGESKALEVALSQGHWVTVKVLLKGDAVSSKLSENDRQFLATTPDPREARDDAASEHEEEYQPHSVAAALRSSFIIRFHLKKYSGSSTYDESIYLKLSTLILDFAEFWVRTSDSITTSQEHTFNDYKRRGNPRKDKRRGRLRKGSGISVAIPRGELRKITIRVFRSGQQRSWGYTSTAIMYPFGNIERGVHGAQFVARGEDEYRRLPDYLGGYITSKATSRTRRFATTPILEMIRRPAQHGQPSILTNMKQSLGIEQDEAIMVPSDGFKVTARSDFECWEQTWRLPIDLGDRATGDSVGIMQFLLSLSPQDEILLQPTQNFFANDVALYGGFSIDIYSVVV